MLHDRLDGDRDRRKDDQGHEQLARLHTNASDRWSLSVRYRGRRRFGEEASVKWVTRENANVDRIACPWLIRRFIDPEAEFIFVGRDEVLEVAEREEGNSYDAPGAKYTHRDGKCSFDVLVEDFELTADPGLVRLAKIVRAADVQEDIDSVPEGRGLSAIAHGFALLHGSEDHRKIELESPMYDALYAWCQTEPAG
jgi:hypothetical protein